MACRVRAGQRWRQAAALRWRAWRGSRWWSCSCRRGSSPRSRVRCRVDLTPLVVAFVGLCAAPSWARPGFAVGLLVDLTLVQTLGLTSLIFTAHRLRGGRLREMRDPQATLMPLLVGPAAAATRCRLFADGVPAGRRCSGQLRAAAPDRARSARRLDRRAARVGARTAGSCRACPMTPASPPRRRAYTTGGLRRSLASMIAFERERRDYPPISRASHAPPSPRSSPCAWRSSAARARDVRDHLLPPLVPADPLRRSVPAEGRQEPLRELPTPRRAAKSSTTRARRWSRTASSTPCRSSPRSCPRKRLCAATRSTTAWPAASSA